MRVRATLPALVALALVAVLAPALASASACPEGEADDCFLPCDTCCVCCSSSPRVVSTSSAAGVHPGLDSGRVDLGGLAAPLTPSPREILHVPKAAAPRL